MGHDHPHSHIDSLSDKLAWPLMLGLIFTVSFFAAELVVAFFSSSIAILGDAFHNASHIAVFLLTYLGLKLAQKPPTKKMTYGFRRIEFLIPAANAVLLMVSGFWLAQEAGRFRLFSPQEVPATPIIITSSLDIVSDVIVAALLLKHNKSLAVFSVMLHLFFDSLISAAVIMGGAAIALWGWYAADAIAAIFIGAFMLGLGVFLLQKTLRKLLDGVPSGISLDDVCAVLLRNKEILAIEDIHIWSIGEGENDNTLTAHLLVEPRATQQLDALSTSISLQLKNRFHITHSTIQLEFKNCEIAHSNN